MAEIKQGLPEARRTSVVMKKYDGSEVRRPLKVEELHEPRNKGLQKRLVSHICRSFKKETYGFHQTK